MEKWTEFKASGYQNPATQETYRSSTSWNKYCASKQHQGEEGALVTVAKSVEVKVGDSWEKIPSVFTQYDEKGNPKSTAFFRPRGEGLFICDIVDEVLLDNYNKSTK